MANVISTYDSGGRKLSFRDTIANIYPVDTPLYSAAKNGKAIARVHQWQHEQLDTPAYNANIEGATAPVTTQNETTEGSSNTQIFEKKAHVTDTNEAISRYGRDKDLARQEMLKGKAVMNDIEWAYAQTQAAATGSVSVARTLTSAYIQLDASVKPAVAATLTEAVMLTAHEATYDLGGNPSMFVVPSSQGTTVAGWASTTPAGGSGDNRVRDFGTGKELTNCVELLVTPYGRMTVVLSRFQQDVGAAVADGITVTNGIALLVDPDYLENAELRPMRRKKLSTGGSFESTLIDWEGTLAVTNPFAHAGINFTA